MGRINIIHPINPVFDENSEILILGSFPSVKSREEMFFYGHPQNRFWKTVAAVFDSDVPVTIEEKIAFLVSRHIALWDVIASCNINGSSDVSIKNARPNDLNRILAFAKIHCIFLNGRTAEKYYNAFLKDKIPVKTVCLPSTSPANAAWNAERLAEEWKIIRNV